MLGQPGRKKTEDDFIDWVNPLLAGLGLEVVALEVLKSRESKLRLFIDRLPNGAESPVLVGIEDCVQVSRLLDEPLEASEYVKKFFGDSPYELEVSSPGIERPLRTAKDFERFQGNQVRVHTFAPLTAEEVGNPEYFKKNPKQKNFSGHLQGIRENKILLDCGSQGNVTIPLDRVAKANLEPDLSLKLREAGQSDKRKHA